MDENNLLTDEYIMQASIRSLKRKKSFEDIVNEENLKKRRVQLSEFLKKADAVEKEYMKLIACLNNEQKIVTYSYCINNEWAGIGDIRSKFRSIAGSSVKCPADITLREYLDSRFVKYGFAEKRNTSNGYEWRWTKKSEELNPRLIFALNYAVRNKKSLNALLGKTGVGENNKLMGPHNRIPMIMKVADSGGSTTIEELTEALSLDKCIVTRHIKHLNEEGYVRFYSCKKKEFWFEMTRSNARKMNALPNTLKKDIAKLLHSKRRKMNREEIGKMLNREGINYISVLLNKLAREKIVGCELLAKDKSRIESTDKLKSLAKMLKQLRFSYYSNKMLAKMQEIPASEALARKAILLYAPHSNYMKMKLAYQKLVSALQFIQDYKDAKGEWPRYTDIENKMGSRRSINTIIETGLAEKYTKRKNHTVYIVSEKGSSFLESISKQKL